jgi:hypothetical protein
MQTEVKEKVEPLIEKKKFGFPETGHVIEASSLEEATIIYKRVINKQ